MATQYAIEVLDAQDDARESALWIVAVMRRDENAAREASREALPVVRAEQMKRAAAKHVAAREKAARMAAMHPNIIAANARKRAAALIRAETGERDAARRATWRESKRRARAAQKAAT